MEKNESETINKIEDDEFFKYFLNSGAKSSLLQTLSITEQVKKLGEGIELLSQELQKQVLHKHNDLLRQADHALKLEGVLNAMNLHVQNLFANAERLKAQIVGPYHALETHTKVLGRLHLASHILRQVNRIQQLSKRLSNTNDPVQKATILQELEQLAADPELKDVDVIIAELRNIRAQQQKVVKLATGSLNQGIVNENVTQTTTALQIFINLGTIKTTTTSILDASLDECRESLKMALDGNGGISGSISKNKGGPGRATLTTSQGFRNRVWHDLEKAFSEELYQQCKQIKFLHITLNNLNAHNTDGNISNQYWIKLGEVIVDEIKNSGAAIQQMLETDYPKLLKFYSDMVRKLNYKYYIFNRNILDKWENSYLSTSLSHLLEPAQSIFVGENIAPSHDQIDSLVHNIANELSVALVEDHLSEKIAKNVSKCIQLFAVKTEQQLSSSSETAQVIAGTPNSKQQLNVQLCNALYYLQTQIQRMVANMKDSLPVNAINIVTDSLRNLDTLTSSVFQPLVGTINATIETIIITIHLESDWTKLQIATNRNSVSCSPYMRELTQFISRVYHTYLTPFENKEVLSKKCSEITVRCIELFVRHASLLRPISQGGRIRLQSDFAHLEHALKVLYPHLTDLGRPYRLLKSMATLITLSPNEIVESQTSGSSVPHSTVLLLLFSFAGSDLSSPHQNTNWTLIKLSAWLDEHPSESDRLDLIAGALQRYETVVRKNNSTTYDPVYPIMSTFLEASVKSATLV